MKPETYNRLRFWTAFVLLVASCFALATMEDSHKRTQAIIWWATGTILFFMPDRKESQKRDNIERDEEGNPL